MKKKIFKMAAFAIAAVAAVAVAGVALVSCGKTTLTRVKQNMSEWTTSYFYGKTENFSAALSSGQRENPYLLNGKSEKRVDFALLSITLQNATAAKIIKATVKIDGVESEKELEINGINPCFMVDLETRLSGSETIEVAYGGQSVKLENLSAGFKVNDEKALEIATKEIEDKILACKKGNVLNAECYLRVLDQDNNNFDKVFWCFSIINVKGESFSVIVSTEDGSVLAKN